MATPIIGNPEVDVQVVELTVDLNQILTPKALKNCDKKILKDLKRTLQHKLADVDFILTEKIEQSIGSVQGRINRREYGNIKEDSTRP